MMNSFVQKHFEQIVQGMVGWVAGVTPKLSDFHVGSRIRTVLEAVAQEIDELYYQAAVGLDAGIRQGVFDAFQFAKRPAVKATGIVRFSREQAAGQDYPIAAGTVVSTAPSTAEAAHEFATMKAATLLTGNTYVDVAVQAAEAGPESNVAAAAVTIIKTPVNGIETVTNALAFTTGEVEESDVKRAARFTEYIQTLQRGTIDSLKYAAGQVDDVAGVAVVDSPMLTGLVFDAAPTGYTDVSTELNLPGGTAFKPFPAVPADGDCFYVGADRRFDALDVFMRQGGGYSAAPATWEYYNGTSWVAVPSISDLSQQLAASDRVSWAFADVAAWKRTAVNSIKKYWVRLRLTTATNIQTAPQISYVVASPAPGNVRVYAHDSLGDLDADLQEAVAAAVEPYRPVGVKVSVLAPVKLTQNVTATIEIAAGYTAATVLAQVQTAITTHFGNLQVGQRLVFDELVQVVMNANDAAVLDITWTTPANDVEISPEQLIVLGTLTITEG